jgi:hypothetical protein
MSNRFTYFGKASESMGGYIFQRQAGIKYRLFGIFEAAFGFLNHGQSFRFLSPALDYGLLILEFFVDFKKVFDFHEKVLGLISKQYYLR